MIPHCYCDLAPLIGLAFQALILSGNSLLLGHLPTTLHILGLQMKGRSAISSVFLASFFNTHALVPAH